MQTTAALVLNMQFAKEGSYEWFFREIVNKQSIIDEMKYGYKYKKDANHQATIIRLEKEEQELKLRAAKELPEDLYQRIGILAAFIRKGEI